MKRMLVILFLCLNIVGCGQVRDNLLRQDYVRALPDSLRKKADLSWVNNQLDIITIWANNHFATPDLFNGYATESWVNQQGFLKNGYTPATTYVTAQYVNTNFVTPDLLAGYATENWVNNKNYTTTSAVRTLLNYDEQIQQYGINVTGNAAATENWVYQNYATKAMLDSARYSQTGSVDSNLLVTKYRIDTMRTNIYSNLGTKSNNSHLHSQYFLSSDTTNLHLQKFSVINDTLSVLRSQLNALGTIGGIDTTKVATHWYVDSARVNIWNNLSLKSEAGHTHLNYFQNQDTANLHYLKFYARDTAISNRAYQTHGHSNYLQYSDTTNLFYTKFNQRDTAIASRALLGHMHKALSDSLTLLAQKRVKTAASSTSGYVPVWGNSTGDSLSTGYAVGTSANNLVKLDGNGKLPAVDGSQLTNIAGGAIISYKTSNESWSGAAGSYTPTSPSISLIANGVYEIWGYARATFQEEGEYVCIDGTNINEVSVLFTSMSGSNSTAILGTDMTNNVAGSNNMRATFRGLIKVGNSSGTLTLSVSKISGEGLTVSLLANTYISAKKN